MLTKWNYLLWLLLLTTTVKSYTQNSCDSKSCLDVLIPNIITPNDDGLNDQLQILFQDCFCQVTQLKLLVFNRWGMCVYQEVAASILDAFAWQGECEQGTQLNEGTYFYLISLKNEINGKERSTEWKGWVMIRR